MNFIVVPLFKAISQVLPDCDQYTQGALKTAETWKTYKETDADKEVYIKKANLSSEQSELIQQLTALQQSIAENDHE